MKNNFVLGAGLGVLVGGLAGYWIGQSHAEPVAAIAPTAPMPVIPTAPPTGAAPAATPAMPPMAPPSANPAADQQIFAAQQAVERDPKNAQAWITLGNGYFDSHQPQKAVEAYDKALALKPGDPNVLTDQGIMYREMRAFPKAAAAFEKAAKADPKHLQSRFNLGVVYAFDLKDPKKAAQAWNQVVALDPTGEQGAKARQALETLKTGPAK